MANGKPFAEDTRPGTLKMLHTQKLRTAASLADVLASYIKGTIKAVPTLPADGGKGTRL